MSKAGDSDSKNTLYCSFCGKSQQELRKLIAGPTVFICDECVELCMDIISEENKSSLVKIVAGSGRRPPHQKATLASPIRSPRRRVREATTGASGRALARF